MGPVLFNIFINHQSDRIECILSRFADGAKERGAANTPDHCIVIQRGLNRLQKWAERILMKFNRKNCKFLHGVKNKSSMSVCGGHSTRKQFYRKELRVLVDICLDPTKNLVPERIVVYLDAFEGTYQQQVNSTQHW